MGEGWGVNWLMVTTQTCVRGVNSLVLYHLKNVYSLVSCHLESAIASVYWKNGSEVPVDCTGDPLPWSAPIQSCIGPASV